MKYQAHRGVGTEFPENTMPAFRAAVAQGYDYIELDPDFTADGQCIVLHDSSLNRTCRHENGLPLESKIEVTDVTYAEILKLDAGIAKARKFRGTKIPLLSEVLRLAKQAAVTVKLDNKIQKFNELQTAALFNIVENRARVLDLQATILLTLKR